MLGKSTGEGAGRCGCYVRGRRLRTGQGYIDNPPDDVVLVTGEGCTFADLVDLTLSDLTAPNCTVVLQALDGEPRAQERLTSDARLAALVTQVRTGHVELVSPAQEPMSEDASGAEVASGPTAPQEELAAPAAHTSTTVESTAAAASQGQDLAGALAAGRAYSGVG